MLDEILGDVEEDVEDNNDLNLYQFNNKNSILQVEKTVA